MQQPQYFNKVNKIFFTVVKFPSLFIGSSLKSASGIFSRGFLLLNFQHGKLSWVKPFSSRLSSVNGENSVDAASGELVLPPAGGTEDENKPASTLPYTSTSSPHQPAVVSSSTQPSTDAAASSSSSSSAPSQAVAAAGGGGASSSSSAGDAASGTSTVTDGAKPRQQPPNVSTSDPLPPG